MIPVEDKVRQLFGAAIETQIAAADNLAEDIGKAAQRLVDCLLADGKIFICGSGGSAANSLHFSTALTHHFGIERPSLPVINLSIDFSCLSAVAEGSHYDQIFARKLLALGKNQDILIVLSTNGNSISILQVVQAANECGMDVIFLCGRDGGLVAKHLGPEDRILHANADNPARVREIHLFILHCFCDLIDQLLFNLDKSSQK